MAGEELREALELYNSGRVAEYKRGVARLAAIQQQKLGEEPSRERKRVTVVRQSSIPPLSWIAKLSRRECQLVIGTKVERLENSVVEGTWDGDFTTGGFRRSSNFFGSGITWGRNITFVPPKHCYEFLFVLVDKAGEKTFVSNSLVFLLSAAGIDLEGDFFREVEARLHPSTREATEKGIDLYDPIVVDTEEYRLLRMMYYNFTADETGRVGLLPQKHEFAPYGYQAYRSYLLEKLKLICSNGSHPDRTSRLQPLLPVSSGYDSPCVAILAKEAGATDAVTLASTVKGKDDSGEHIAKRLGLNISDVKHIMGAEVPSLAASFEGSLAESAYEFIATAGIGDDVAFLPFEPFLNDRIFLSGALGDSIWRRNSTLPPGLPVRVAYGKSITEFRLRTGFAWIPVPVIGARFPRPIKRMNRSEEMSEYTLWKAYDRPFPRRVIEEAGIPRGEFARAKAAASPTPMNRADLFKPAVTHVIRRYTFDARETDPERVRRGLLERLRYLGNRLRKRVRA